MFTERGMNAPRSGSNVIAAKKILVLHGNRQTGELLLKRMGKLRRRLRRSNRISGNTNDTKVTERRNNNDDHTLKQDLDATVSFASANNCYELVAPDAPHIWKPEGSTTLTDRNEDMRTWWHREGTDAKCAYVGLEKTLAQMHAVWNIQKFQTNQKSNDYGNLFPFVGILGFSQGGRLVHLMSYLHMATNGKLFPGLRFVVLVSAYDAPLPTNMTESSICSQISEVGSTGSEGQISMDCTPLKVPSLHVMGSADRWVKVEQSRRLVERYDRKLAEVHEHSGGHHVPMTAKDVSSYLTFISKYGHFKTV